MGHWNHRILAYEYEGHVEFKIHEVFYMTERKTHSSRSVGVM